MYDIYYSHSRTIVDTDQEREELEFLRSICDRSSLVLDPLHDIPAGGDYAVAVAACKRVVVSKVMAYSGLPEGGKRNYIGKGVASDIDNARKFDIPVYCLSVERPYSLLKVMGYTRVEGGDARVKYAILNIEYSRDWAKALETITRYKTMAAQLGKYQTRTAATEDDIRAVIEIKQNAIFGADISESEFFEMVDLPPYDLDFDMSITYIASLSQEEVDGILNLLQDINTAEEWRSFREFLNARAAKTAFIPEACPSCGTITMHTPREKLGKCPTCGNPVSFMLVAEVSK